MGSFILAENRARVAAIVRRKYRSYRIGEPVLEFVDNTGTVRESKGLLTLPTEAVVVVKNDEERRTLHLEKVWGFWKIVHDEPDYGRGVPEGVYYFRIRGESIYRDVDMDDYLSKLKCVIVPFKDGNMFVDNFKEWGCYSYQYADEILKTSGGRLYELNMKTLEWEKSEMTYSSVEYQGNYVRVSEEDVRRAIDRLRELGL
ncbi:MAG: hypothetical protein K6F92_06255 [Lachnospiraceae bacterium]|nr:hypothetical protein [Lachnospiraceae bacterium]